MKVSIFNPNLDLKKSFFHIKRSLIALLVVIGLVCLANSKPFGEGREGKKKI